jgi:hypothetical protein
MHLVNYSNPPLQRQSVIYSKGQDQETKFPHRLIRAILMPAFFTVFAFLSICFYNEAKYLLPVADFYEAFALVAIFYYMNLIVLPAAPRRTMSFYGGDVSALEQYVPGGHITRYSVSPTLSSDCSLS